MPVSSSSSVRVVQPKFDRDQVIGEFRRGISVLVEALSLYEVTLFGSCAASGATAFINLLVIYSGSPREESFATARRCIPLRRLEPHVYTADQATGIRPTLDRMTRTRGRLL